MTDTKNTVSDERWIQQLSARIVVDVCELERDSPEDDPMACIVYAPELTHIVERRVSEALQSLPVGVKGLPGDDNELAQMVEDFQLGTVAFANEPDQVHHQITLTPPQLRDFLASLDLSPAEGEPVAWVTADILAAMKRGGRAVPGWKRSADFNIPLYAGAPSNPVVSDEWQPIETAPMDWSDMLLHVPDLKSDFRTVCEGYFDTELSRWRSPALGLVNPTSWMPLPAAPAALSVKPQSGSDKP